MRLCDIGLYFSPGLGDMLPKLRGLFATNRLLHYHTTMHPLASWVSVPSGSDFPIQNLPYGIFRTQDYPLPRLGVAIGEYVLDLLEVARMGLFDELRIDKGVFSQGSLNALIALGSAKWAALRQRLQQLLSEHDPYGLRVHADSLLVRQRDATMLMPLRVPNYTDFYASEEHATNVGIMFRGKENALMPNWKHLPVGYHGRASSIVVSGTPIRRPKGQYKPADAPAPLFGPSQKLDFELELAFVVGSDTEMGSSIPVSEAESHIFGLLLFNDWSARDLQAWEYVPLGPFLGKNFASSVSAWVVPLQALEPFRVQGPQQDPMPLPYLQQQGARNLDIHLEVSLQPQGQDPAVISRSNAKYLYWSMAQQLAHHTVNGCNMRVGDLCASGTISGPTPDSYGSLLELSWNGSKPLPLAAGVSRTFLEDGDILCLRAYAERDGLRIGFGQVCGQIIG